MKQESELEKQKRIYILISKQPGLHINKIGELLNIDRQLITYHLRYLEKHNLITITKEKGYTRCYIKGEIGIEDKKKLSLLRQEIPLKIVLYLLKHPYTKHREILAEFDIAKSTLSYHLKKLIHQEIIDIQDIGTEKGYLIINEKEIINFLIKYKPSRISRGLKDTWTDFTIYKKK
ncbi:MAG: winged helix-turn-helix transcriptional regulator [Methanobacteriota archaeon]